jgi:hypothetical protein
MLARLRTEWLINTRGHKMLHGTRFISLCAGVLSAAFAMAQATPPADAPAGATGLCKDGSYWTGATKRGACHGHKGVQDWYASSSSSAPAATSTATPAAAAPAATKNAPAPAATAAAPAATPAAPAPAPAQTAPATKGSPASTVQQAPGGGPGLVWVNTGTKVYHCSTDRWYGKTKSGEYMSESDAIAKGNRADHGKACSK